MTPAEEFRDAARIVREYAGKAGRGPWSVPGIGDFGWSVTGPGSWAEPGTFTGVETADSEQGKADAEWIALANPEIAEPLAVVFDSAAVDAEQIGYDFRLLALARLIRTQHQAMQGEQS